MVKMKFVHGYSWPWSFIINIICGHRYASFTIFLFCFFVIKRIICVWHTRNSLLFINELQLKKEAKAKEAKLAAESDAKEKDDGVDLPLVPPEMQVDGLAEKDELEAQLNQQMMATAELNGQAEENNGK